MKPLPPAASPSLLVIWRHQFSNCRETTLCVSSSIGQEVLEAMSWLHICAFLMIQWPTTCLHSESMLGIWHFLFQLSLCKSIVIQVRNNFAYTCRRKVIFCNLFFCKLAALELIRNMENSMLCMQNFVMQKSVQKQEFAWLLMMLVESPHDTDKFLQWEWSFALFKICAKNASAIFSLPSTELLHYRNLHFPQQNSLL